MNLQSNIINIGNVRININLLIIFACIGLVISKVFFQEKLTIIKPSQHADFIYRDDNDICYRYRLVKVNDDNK